MLFAVLLIFLPIKAWCGPENIPPPPPVIANPPGQNIQLDDDHWDFEEQFDQPVDHDHPGGAKFKQRLFIDPRAAKNLKTAPVIYHLCGENACNYLAPLGITELARKQGAIIVQLEHRYYGESRPFPKLTKENLQYLTVEQALADAEAAQKYVQQKFGYRGSWVAFGCSYPGALAAFYRTKHPELVKGAVASGAPVRAEWRFTGYEAWVFDRLGKECALKVRSTLHDMQQVFTSGTPEERAHWAGRLGLKNFPGVVEAATNAVQGAVQYGRAKDLCRLYQENSDGMDALAAYLKKTGGAKELEAMSDPSRYSGSDIESPLLWNSRAWTYQTCRQFGYGQSAAVNCEFSVFPSLADDHKEQFCLDTFNVLARDQIDEFNHRYFDQIQNKKTKNILFINGSEDPWSLLSIKQGNNRNPNLSTLTVQGEGHCSEYDSAAGDNARARAEMEKAFQRWK